MNRYAVFLDIDGVFTTARQHLAAGQEGEMWSHFDPVVCQFLNKIDSWYDIDWVLMSTWVVGLNQANPTIYHWVMSTFRNAGFNGRFPYPNWKTEDPVYPQTRAHSVKEYLELQKYDDFLVIDDNDYNFNNILGRKRFIKTDPRDGMRAKDFEKILSLTGMWRKK